MLLKLTVPCCTSFRPNLLMSPCQFCIPLFRLHGRAKKIGANRIAPNLYHNRLNLYRTRLDLYCNRLDLYYNRLDLYYNRLDLYYNRLDLYNNRLDFYHNRLDFYHNRLDLYYNRLDLYYNLPHKESSSLGFGYFRLLLEAVGSHCM